MSAENQGVSVAAAAAASQGIDQAAFQRQQSVAERKARKAMLKKGFEQVAGVTNISVIRKKAGMFSIASPDVYKNASEDTWILFGEARMDNFGGRGMNPAAQRASQAAAAAATASASAAAAATSSEAAPADAAAAAAAVEGGSEEKADETGVESGDIELVVAQAGCTREQAVAALKNNGMDVVNAIMELTT
ncbi:hypothetical protein GGF46_003420 [Coemansia sp. RSA 552]|nr:hypothetical protein GGF46_003420 [Coemansia sp. RSA 552]